MCVAAGAYLLSPRQLVWPKIIEIINGKIICEGGGSSCDGHA